MGIVLRLAWRNLWRQRRRTLLTASAIAFSATLLVFLISIQLGAYDMILDTTLHLFPGHVQVQHRDYLDQPQMRATVPDAAALAERMRARLKDAGVAARGYAFSLASSRDRSYGVQVVGVQPRFEPTVSSIARRVASGRYFSGELAPELVLGETLARNLRIKVGDELTLLGSGKDGSMAATVLPVVGIFNSGSPDIDRGMVQMPLATFQEVFSMGGDAHAIVISAPALERLPSIVAGVQALLPPPSKTTPPLAVRTWQEFMPGLEQLIQVDKISNGFTYTILIVVVTFSILNTFLMAVLERTREFGIMLALGAKPLRIGALVMLESLLLTLLGLAVGLLLGGGIAYYFYLYGFTFPGLKELHAQYGLPGVVHPQISWVTLLLGPSIILLFTTIAAVYPALRIRRLQPVEAIRTV